MVGPQSLFGVVVPVHPVPVELARAQPPPGSRARRRRRVPVARDGSRRQPSSNRHSSTASAVCENTEKFVPDPSQVAPSGYGSPGLRAAGMNGKATWRPRAPIG